MAYMNQEKKKEIAAELKKFMPKDWKYSLSVQNHSTIVMTIRQAPVDLLKLANDKLRADNNLHNDKDLNYLDTHGMRTDRYFEGELLELFNKIHKALNLNNFDNSDSMTDYFHVGHYVSCNIGTWEKPFICKA